MKRNYILMIIIGLSAIVLALQLSSPPKMPTVEVVKQSWTKADSKSYARDKLFEWTEKQWSCLTKLWGKESAWSPDAYNPIEIAGKNAGGIPQLLGLDPDTHPTIQIERGLKYIEYRYDTPCHAWAHFKKKGWY